jgi:hypothetical protein
MVHNKHSQDFGKKEKVLNYACQTYQLSRPSKVGAVMALIRECQPKTIEECQQSYFRMHSYGMPVTCRQNISTERCKPTVCKERVRKRIPSRMLRSVENAHSVEKDCKFMQSCIPSRMLHSVKNAHSEEKDCKFMQSCIPLGMLRSVENAHSVEKDCKFVQSCIPLGMLRSVENLRTSLFLHSVGMQPINYK